MDEKAQREGERRVQQVLIDPLEDLGLAKPSTMVKAQFEEMKRKLCQKLAYMTTEGLVELRGWCEDHPGGKDGDRFPIALKILKKAPEIEVPDTGPSPLILRIFRSDLGREALAKGYAPELLAYVRKAREWPGMWTLSKIKDEADNPARRLADVEMRMARGDEMSPDDLQFRNLRRAALRNCEAISEQAQA